MYREGAEPAVLFLPFLYGYALLHVYNRGFHEIVSVCWAVLSRKVVPLWNEYENSVEFI